MKKLIYVICFGAVVSGFGDMQAMEAAIADASAQIEQIEQTQRREKIRLCAFDFNGAMAALEAKDVELSELSHSLMEAGVFGEPNMTRQQFRVAHPILVTLEENPVIRDDLSGKTVGAIRFALSIIEGANVHPRDHDHLITEKQMDQLIKKAEYILTATLMNIAHFKQLPEAH